MANLTSTLTVRMIDAVTGPARAAANSIRGIGKSVDQVNARRLAIAGAVNNMSRDVGRAARGLQRNMTRMSAGLSMPTGFAAFFGGRSVYNFEKVSNAVQAVTMMTDKQRKSIQSYAKELNELFPYTNAEIMEGAFELARAGLTFEQVMGTLRGSLNLGLAGDIGLGESADIATNVLTAMRLPMKTMEQAAESLTRVNDALSYAAVRSNTDVRMMGQTFKYVGPMAAAAGMSIEEVTAAAMIMANNGIRASEAGVAMRSALVRMVRPTKPMLKALEALNVSVVDFVKGGRQIASADVIRWLAVDGIDASSFADQIDRALEDPKLQKSLSALTLKLTDIIVGDNDLLDRKAFSDSISETLVAAGSQVDLFGFINELKEKGADLGAVARIFDARQGARLITLLAGDVNETLAKVIAEAAGSTDKMSRIRMQGVVGDTAALVAAVENLFLAIADAGVLKAATEAIKSITSGLKDMAASNPQLLEWATYTLMLAGALGPIAMVAGGVLSFFTSLAALLILISRIGKGALAVAGVGMLGGGAAGVAGGAGGAAAGAAAAAKGGLWTKLFRGAGAIGVGLLVKDALSFLDPKGNLGGLTSGVDGWAEKNLGFNPSAVGGSPSEASMRERQGEIDARLKGLGYGPADIRERGVLEFEQERIKRQLGVPPAASGEAASSAHQTMGGYNSALQEELTKTEAMVDESVSRIKEKLNFIARPIIAPRIDGSAISGVHADIGIE